MSEYSNLNAFLSDLKQSQGAVWIEDGAIHLSLANNDRQERIADFIRSNRGNLLDILAENNIHSEDSFNQVVIFKSSKVDSYPLSPAQERLWFIEQYEGGTNAYNIPAVFELHEQGSIDGLKYAIQNVIKRHEILRTTVVRSPEGDNLQKVNIDPLKIEEVTIPGNTDYKEVIRKDIDKPFDLSSEYPIRVKIYKVESGLKKEKTLFLINTHHIASDGWSLEIFHNELWAYYEAHTSNNKNFRLADLDIQYKDYALWQRDYLQGEMLKTQLSYWKNKLSGLKLLEFPTDYVRTGQIDYKGGRVDFSISRTTSQKLRSLARDHGVTLNSVLLSSINILLNKYTKQNDIVIGTTTAGRHYRQVESLIGYFANTLAYRTKLSDSQSFEDLIKQTHLDQIEVQANQDVPFEKIVDELNIDRDSSRHPVFQVLFSLQSFGNDDRSADQKKHYLPYRLNDTADVEKFDLSIYVNESAEEFTGWMSFATRLFKSETIQQIANHYVHLLNILADAPQQPYSEVSLLSESEYRLLVYDWNPIDRTYPQDKTIHQLFQDQVKKNPDKIALALGQKELSYKELNERANLLARHIRSSYESKVGSTMPPDTLIALCLDRSFDMIISILAVLKAGAAYVPMDPAYPQERIDYIIKDTSARLIITHEAVTAYSSIVLPEEKLIRVDFLHEDVNVGEKSDLPEYCTAENLAYVIYTSGTTGEPKGTMVEHRNVMRLFTCTDQQFHFGEDDVWTMFHSYVFDFSVWELWGALIYGGKLLLIAQEDAKDTERFFNLCCENKVTVLNQTPSAFYRFADIAALSQGSRLALRYIIFGGEALNANQLKPWWNFQKAAGLSAKLINMYGITETTVHVTYRELSENEATQSNIGKPIADLQAYILDPNLEPVPIGVLGELYIGGAGLSRGYLNRPELTDQRFILNPFQDQKNRLTARLYKTGDVAKWLHDGNIEYIGRNDDQVKIRGYRIELGEIEAALSKVHGIKQSCVVIKSRGIGSDASRYLVGYYIPEQPQTTDQDGVRKELMLALPEYMVPAILIEVATFSLTINGKLDKKALPEPDLNSLIDGYVAPTTSREILLCTIWQEVLGLEKVGVNDDFFRIGGDSILSIRLVSKMKNAGYGVGVKDLFKYKSIKGLLDHAGTPEQSVQHDYAPFSILNIEKQNKIFRENDLQPEQIQDVYPASYLQVGMLLQSLKNQSTDTYHDVFSYVISAPYDHSKFERIWQKLVDKNEQMRTTFIESENGYVNVIHKALPVGSKITIMDRDADLRQVGNSEKHIDFDLSVPGQFRLFIFQDEQPRQFTLMFSFHHAITDGWSVASLMSEFVDEYVHDKTLVIEADAPAYGKFIRKEIEALESDSLKEFWLDYLHGYDPNPKSTLSATKISFESILVTENVDPGVGAGVLALSRKLDISPDIIFLGAYNLVLSLFTNTADLAIGVVMNGRLEESGGDRVFGLHLNTLPMRFKLEQRASLLISEYLTEIFRDKLAIGERKAYPYGKIKADQNTENDLYNCAFNYVHFHIAEDNYESRSISTSFFHEKTPIPFELNIGRYVDSFSLSIEGYGNFIDKTSAEIFKECFINCIRQMVSESHLSVKDIQLTTPEEYKRTVVDWNETEVGQNETRTINEIVEAQAEQNPDFVAVVFRGSSLTFKDLNERSNQLARHIRSTYKEKIGKDLSRDTPIALYFDRSLEMIISILAVLKAGAVYVPIDPGYPAERVEHILEDIQAKIILSHKGLGGSANLPADKIIYSDLEAHFYKSEDAANLPRFGTHSDLCYIIYTSGSTGTPKGVMIEHKSVTNLVQDLIAKYDIHSSERFLLFSNYVFDASVEQIFLSLFSGGTLFIIDNSSILDNNGFGNFLTANRITHLDTTPTYLSTVDVTALNTIKRIVVGAEYFPEELFDKYRKIVPKIINAYGPTETAITTLISIDSHFLNRATIRNTKAYVLDLCGAPVPVGAIGELYLGGIGVARGYLNQPGLTNEKFVPDVFAMRAGDAQGDKRMYKTGDLVRWRPDGHIQFIGRNDEQVKILGHRIEVGEIESVLRQIPGLNQCCVLVKDRRNGSGAARYMVAYYVTEGGKGLAEESIISFLEKQLPDYMIPSAFVKMDSLPTTVNGKLDKRALPDPELKFDGNDSFIPTSKAGNLLREAYGIVLGLPADQVSMDKNFFRMGGNSILTIQLKRRLNEIEGFENITVPDLFKYNSINKLIDKLNNEKEKEFHYLKPVLEDKDHEVAVIGISGSFSGAEDVSQFWHLIAGQLEGIQFYSTEDCRENGVSEDLLANPGYIPVAGLVKDIELFDPFFWDMSPNEAKQHDPQIRKFIEHCWYALESAGYVSQRKNKVVGVFAGSGTNNYFEEHVLNGKHNSPVNYWEASNSNVKDALATKAAFMLGLTGPANSINTACSTGLVSIVEACKNLRLGTCDMALAGGISLSLPGQIGYVYNDGMILSKDGHCRSFDRDASGTTGGSGAGIVLLRRLKDAEKDGDKIIAVIKGYATNNDGDRKVGYTAPSLTGQCECIIKAQKMAGVTSDMVDYIECHGTGTHLGDPIEIQALTEAFAFNKKGNPVNKTVLGSVKANIGHADSAAGVAGFIKLCAMLQKNVIPGQANYNLPNPELNLEKTNFEINSNNKDWLPTQERPRIAGVSSFGIGGTNAHVIVSDYAQDQSRLAPKSDQQIRYIVPLSAKSKRSLEKYQDTLLKFLETSVDTNDHYDLSSIAFTLQERREQFSYRAGFSVKSVSDLINKLQQKATIELAGNTHNRTVFMFPGQGSQYVNMARGLYDNEPVFCSIVNDCISIANKHTSSDLSQILFPSAGDHHDINQTQWSQICLFIVEYSLAKYLESLGVKADAYIGHSVGEYVAATLSGVFDLADAIKIVVKRGELMQKMEFGSMLSIAAIQEIVASSIRENSCEVSVLNSDDDIVASGSKDNILRLKQSLDRLNVQSVVVPTSHAYHSRTMEPAALELQKSLESVRMRKPAKVFISCLTGEVAGAEVARPDYWSMQLRNIVRFGKGIDTLSKHFSHQVNFIEVGPGRGLNYFVGKYIKTNNFKSIGKIQLLASAKEDENTFTSPGQIMSRLWMTGVVERANDPSLFNGCRFVTDLPLYQFDFQKCWIEKNKSESSGNRLKFLPEEKWLSTAVWMSKGYLNKKPVRDLFKNAIVFIRREQVDWLPAFDGPERFWHVVLEPGLKEHTIDLQKRRIQIGPDNDIHFEKLSTFLKKERIPIETLLHMCSMDNNGPIEASLDYSFFSLFLIRRHLLNIPKLERLFVITNGLTQITNQEIIHPANGTLPGTVRNINHEFLHIDSRIVDIGAQMEGGLQYMAEVLEDKNYRKCQELMSIRFSQLWLQRFESLSSAPNSDETIRDGDVILVTGGLGGIALSVANRISEHHKVQFVLVSRKNIFETQEITSYQKEKAELIARIKQNGSGVHIECLDLSDAKQTSQLLTKVKKDFKTISGIIHTAGVSPLDPGRYTIAELKESFKGKLYGIENIINNIEISGLRYICSTSSLASIMGDISRIEYCASNSYLDFLPSDKRRLGDVKVISINWPGWSDMGMVREDKPSDAVLGAMTLDVNNLINLNALQSRNGSELFYKIMNSSGFGQIAVSKLDIHLLKKKLFSDEHAEVRTQNKISIIGDSYTEGEYQIASVICEILGIETIALDDNFFKIGGNSLLAVRLVSSLKRINIHISLQEIVNHNTVRDIYESQKTVSLENSIIVPLRINNNGNRNVFFIHALGGTTMVYNEFTEKLDDSYNYYGIQNINIYGGEPLKAKSMSELAEIYLAEILMVQSEGPFIFAGSSFGGTLSYEIALKLKARGKDVKCVFMFDSWANFSDEFKKKDVFIADMKRQLDEYSRSLGEINVSDKSNLIESLWKLMELLLLYRPEKLDGIPVILFKAQDITDIHATNEPSDTNGWVKYCREVVTHLIPGDHVTLTQGEGLKMICDIMKTVISPAPVKISQKN